MKHSPANIESIAQTLFPDFKPKDVLETAFSFHFTLPPNCTYKVFFEKDERLNWKFVRFEEVVI